MKKETLKITKKKYTHNKYAIKNYILQQLKMY